MIPDRTRVGTINELVVAQDLLRRGFDVYTGMSGRESCDFIASMNRHFIAVEVTTGSRRSNGKITSPPKNANNFDVLAIVVDDKEIVYDPPAEEWPDLFGVPA